MERMKHSLVPTWLGLVIGSWVGLVWGSLISLPVGIGFGVAAGSAFGGFLAVPLWGTVWGMIGLGRQRENAVKTHGITLVEGEHPLAQRTYALSQRLGLKTKPWVGIMLHANAYAIGKDADNALVVVGQPLIDSLTEAEVDAIIGHELGHVVNNDMRRMGLARSFQNSLVWYLRFSATLQRWVRWILTWASEFMILGLSRKREFHADAVGAALTSKEAMISALERVHDVPSLSEFETEHARLMFRGISLGTLLSTHPTLEDRCLALREELFIRQLPLQAFGPALKPSPAVVPTAESIAYVKSS